MMHRHLINAPAKLRLGAQKPPPQAFEERRDLGRKVDVWTRLGAQLISLPSRMFRLSAGRVITGKMEEPYPILLEELNWLPLTTKQKLKLYEVCYNIVNSLCLPSHYFFQPSSSPRSKPFLELSHIKSSFL